MKAGGPNLTRCHSFLVSSPSVSNLSFGREEREDFALAEERSKAEWIESQTETLRSFRTRQPLQREDETRAAEADRCRFLGWLIHGYLRLAEA